MSFSMLGFLNFFLSPVPSKAFLIFGLFIGTFHFYRKGKGLGFNGDKLLDVSIYPLTFSVLVYNLTSGLPQFRLSLTFLSFFFLFSLFVRREGWSFPKIADTVSISAPLALTFFPFPSVFFNLLFLGTFFLLGRISLFSPRSGFIYYLFMIIFSLISLLSGFLIHQRLKVEYILFLIVLSLSLVRLKKGSYFLELLRIYSLIGAFGRPGFSFGLLLRFFTSRLNRRREEGREPTGIFPDSRDGGINKESD